jgi:hypothetical protein
MTVPPWSDDCGNEAADGGADEQAGAFPPEPVGITLGLGEVVMRGLGLAAVVGAADEGVGADVSGADGGGALDAVGPAALFVGCAPAEADADGALDAAAVEYLVIGRGVPSAAIEPASAECGSL